MLINKLQKILFGIFLGILAIVLPIQEYYNFIDSALVLYGGIILVGLSILTYWVYWYIISKERSAIFIINGFIVLSVVITMCFQFVFRWIFVFNKSLYIELINSDLWAYRVFPEFLVLGWLLCWIVSRMYGKLPIIPAEDNGSCFTGIMDENRLNVLTIDDNTAITELLKAHLVTLEKYNVFTANTVEDGLHCFRARKYFLIFLDLKFGNDFIASRELAKTIRSEDKYVWISILTGFADNALNQDLLEFVDDIVIKPLTFSDLKAYLLLWNLKYKRRIYYMKRIDSKLDCYGEKIKDIHFLMSKKEDKYDDMC